MGDLKILEQLGFLGMIAEGGVEDVERTVVICRRHVIHVILHLHFDAEALVVFATFKALIPVFL